MKQKEQLEIIQSELKSIKQKLEGNEQVPKDKGKINPIYATILVALIGFVGTTIGNLINNSNSNVLEERKFEFELIKKGLEQPNQDERVKYLKFLSKLKLIKDMEMNAALDSVVLDPNNVPDLSEFIKEAPIGSMPLEFNNDITDKDPRIGALKAAREEVGNTEDSNYQNGGPYVQKYMQGGQTYPWAAGFISWCYSQNLQHTSPFKYAYSFEVMKSELIKHNWYFEDLNIKELRPGDIYFIGFYNKIISGGIIDSIGTDFIKGIEGNTNEDGSREGKGVFYKIRAFNKIIAVGKID